MPDLPSAKSKLAGRWTIYPVWHHDDDEFPAAVDPELRSGGEPIAVVRADALRHAVEMARLFNRGGMTWLEYDRELVRLEQIANG